MGVWVRVRLVLLYTPVYLSCVVQLTAPIADEALVDLNPKEQLLLFLQV